MSAKRKKDIEEKYTTDRQEKVELFRQIKCDIHSENEAVCTAAKNKLYDELVGFIGLEINRYFSTYKTEYYEEMMHEAWVGIMENIDDYDPGRSLPTTWAHYAIVHQIKLFINILIPSQFPCAKAECRCSFQLPLTYINFIIHPVT